MKRLFLIGLSIAILSALATTRISTKSAVIADGEVALDLKSVPAEACLDETASKASEFIENWYEGEEVAEAEPEDGVSLSVAWSF